MKKKIISLMLSLVVIGSMIIPGTVASLTAEDTSDDSGLKLSKTATYNENDGTYTIKLEAYATGEKVISEVKGKRQKAGILTQNKSRTFCPT